MGSGGRLQRLKGPPTGALLGLCGHYWYEVSLIPEGRCFAHQLWRWPLPIWHGGALIMVQGLNQDTIDNPCLSQSARCRLCHVATAKGYWSSKVLHGISRWRKACILHTTFPRRCNESSHDLYRSSSPCGRRDRDIPACSSMSQGNPHHQTQDRKRTRPRV